MLQSAQGDKEHDFFKSQRLIAIFRHHLVRLDPVKGGSAGAEGCCIAPGGMEGTCRGPSAASTPLVIMHSIEITTVNNPTRACTIPHLLVQKVFII